MDLNLIRKLKDKGVASDVIIDLLMDEEVKETPEPQQVQTETPEPIAAPDPAPAAAAPAPTPDPIMDKLDKLIGVLQANAILTTGRDSTPGQSVDDILAEMIAPAGKGGK